MYLAILSLVLWLSVAGQAKVYVSPDRAHLTSSLDLSHLTQGLLQAKTSITTFQNVLSSSSNISTETKELLRVVIKSGEFQVKSIQQLFDKLDRSNKRQGEVTQNPP